MGNAEYMGHSTTMTWHMLSLLYLLFTFVVSVPAQKCTKISGVEYDTPAAAVSSQEVTAAHMTCDNQSSVELDCTVTISHLSQLTESYEYFQTSGWENEAHMDIAAGTHFTFPAIDEFSLEVTAGTNSIWDFHQSWARTDSREYSEGDGHQTVFTTHCPPQCACTLDVLVTTTEGVIPYVLKSQSGDGADVCEERGDLAVNYSYDARVVVTDNC